MRSLIWFFIFSFSIVNAQTAYEQSLYNSKIDLVVDKGGGAYNYLDSDGELIGNKKEFPAKVIYYDKNHRKIKVVLKESVQPEKREPVQNSTNSQAEDSRRDKLRLLLQQDNTIKIGSFVVQRINRKVYYYNLQAELIRISEKKRFSGRIVYKDVSGNFLGSKKKQRNGEVVYKDSSRRVTGKSIINANGVLVYESIRNRITPQFMIEDPFYLE